MSIKRIGVFLLCSAIAMSVIAGCSSGARSGARVGPGAPFAARGISQRTPAYSAPPTLTSEAVIAATEDKVTSVADVSERIGAEISIPDHFGDRTLQEIRVTKPTVTPTEATFEFDKALLVEVFDMKTVAEARQMVNSGDSDTDLSLLRRQVTVNGSDGRMIDHTDVPPRDDGAGNKVPGTGVYVNTSKVAWAVGTYVVQVRHRYSSADELLQFARQLSVTPR